MAKSFRVAVLGNQKAEEDWYHHYGLQSFDLSVEQICTLLEKANAESGINAAELGAQPVMTYQVMGGGRFFPSVSREEVAQLMQGVDILVAVIPSSFHYYDFMSRDFYHCLLSENLMDRCKFVIARLVNVEGSKQRRQRRNRKDMTPEAVMKMHGLKTEKLNSQLCVIADPGFKTKGKSKKKQHQENGEGVNGAISELRGKLLGEEVKGVVVTPVKETVTAGKALLDLGHRLTHWIGGLVRAH